MKLLSVHHVVSVFVTLDIPERQYLRDRATTLMRQLQDIDLEFTTSVAAKDLEGLAADLSNTRDQLDRYLGMPPDAPILMQPVEIEMLAKIATPVQGGMEELAVPVFRFLANLHTMATSLSHPPMNPALVAEMSRTCAEADPGDPETFAKPKPTPR